MLVTIGHTHDADDAFMFHSMLNKRSETDEITFEDFLEPITALNEKATSGVYDMTAVSVAALPGALDEYSVLRSGACMAEKRGPLFVACDKRPVETVAVPGFETTAYYAARLFNPDLQFFSVSFDKILDCLERGEVDAGVLISEDQMRVDSNAWSVIDLGEWWNDKTGMPLPLGVDLIRKSLPDSIKTEVARIFKNSIRDALNNPEEAMEYALRFGRGINEDLGEEFISTFVTNDSVDMGARGEAAIKLFLAECADAGIIKAIGEIDFQI